VREVKVDQTVMRVGGEEEDWRTRGRKGKMEGLGCAGSKRGKGV